MPNQEQIQQFIEAQKTKGTPDSVTQNFLRSKGVDPTPFFQEQKRPVSEKLGTVLSSIFAGGKIGEYIGTKIAENAPETKRLKGMALAPGEDPSKKITGDAFKTPSGKEIVGDVASAALNILPFTKAGGAFLGAKTIVGQGAKKFIESAGKKALLNTTFGAAVGGARAAAENGDVISGAKKGAATFGGLALSGSLLKGFLLNQGTQKLSQKMYEYGLGLSKKNLSKEEKFGHKKAAFLMDKIGAGTPEQLKEKMQGALDTTFDQSNKILATTKGKYKTEAVRNAIVAQLQKQFKNTLTTREIKSLVNNMPLGALKKKGTITLKGLNELRVEFNRNHLTDNAWLATQLPQNKNAFRTASSVMSELVKTGDKKFEGKLRELFAEESAYITGLKGLEQISSRTMGPVNTGARIFGAAAGGGAGFAAGGPAGAVMGAAAGELANSTLGRTGAAVILRKAGLSAERLSRSELSQLITLLSKMGIVKAE